MKMGVAPRMIQDHIQQKYGKTILPEDIYNIKGKSRRKDPNN